MSTAEGAPRIVVGVDGSASSVSALRWAAKISAATGAGIDAVTAWEITSNYGWSSLPPYAREEEAEKALTSAVDEVFGANRPLDLRLIAREGSPAHVLLAAARGAEVLVVGSRGHSGFNGLLHGSVSAKVAELASCPVLVVHDSPEEAK